jgi:hypothetical protein
MNTEPPTGDDLQRMLVSMKHNVLEHADDRRPKRRGHRSGIVIAAVALLALGTASGAVALAVVPQMQQAAPVASPTPSLPEPSSTPSSAQVVETPEPTATGSSGATPVRYPTDCRALFSDADRERFFGTTPLTQTPDHLDATVRPAPAPVRFAGSTWLASTWIDCLWKDPRSDISHISVSLGTATQDALAGRQDLFRSQGATCAPGEGGTVCTHTSRADPYPVDGTDTFWWDDEGYWVAIGQVNMPTSGLLRATIDGMRTSARGEGGDSAGTWTITGDGVGPITIGSSYRDAVDEVGAVLPKPDLECPNPNVSFFGSADVNITVLQENGKVVGIDTTGLTTAAGIGVGETLAQLKTAYPGLVQTPGYGEDASDAFSLWSVRDGARYVTFVMDEDGRYTTGVWVGDDPRPPYEYCG